MLQGTRQLLQFKIEKKDKASINRFKNVRGKDGFRGVIHNGSIPAWKILTILRMISNKPLSKRLGE